MKALKRMGARLRTLQKGEGAAILLYHRVAALESDPQWLAVKPNHFDEQMALLRKKFVPLSLQEFRGRQKANAIPARAVVVTFDDGYADNLSEAKPILGKHEIHATVFVVSGQVGTAKEFWWDELEGVLFPGGVGEWNLISKENPTSEHELYRKMSEDLRKAGALERERILSELVETRGVKRPERTVNRALNGREVSALSKEGLVEIGAHTITHSSLAALKPEEQRTEIKKSGQVLGEMINGTVRSFAYPFGTEKDYTTETVKIIRESGYECACANVPKLARRDSADYELPRFLVRDWNGEKFERELDGFFTR